MYRGVQEERTDGDDFQQTPETGFHDLKNGDNPGYYTLIGWSEIAWTGHDSLIAMGYNYNRKDRMKLDRAGRCSLGYKIKDRIHQKGQGGVV